MFDDLTLGDLKSQLQQHLMMIEEVLGGMDLCIQGLEKRIERIENGLGVSDGAVKPDGWVADIRRAKEELAALREFMRRHP